MKTYDFARAAGAGMIAASLTTGFVLAATPAARIESAVGDLLMKSPRTQDLNRCVVTAVLDNAQNPTDPRYREEEVARNDGPPGLMISALREIKGGHTVGPGVVFNPQDSGSQVITVGYSWRSALKPGEKPGMTSPGARDTFTIVTLDKNNLDGYTALETQSGPKVSKKIEKEMKQQALYTAGQIIDCMQPFRLPPIPAIKY